MSQYPFTTVLKHDLMALNHDESYPGNHRVWVRTWADGDTLVGIRHPNENTLRLYEALKAKCRELGHEVSNEGKPGTAGEQTFQVKQVAK